MNKKLSWVAFLLPAIVLVAIVVHFGLLETRSDIASESSQEEEGFADPSGIRPLAAPKNLDPEKVALGRLLFHDPRLSQDNSISCASCHQLSRGGVDGRAFSPGIGGHLGTANTPTVFNSSLNFKQFWDGRAIDLKDQVAGPIHNPVEMGTTWEAVIAKLKTDSNYGSRFGNLYSDGITAESITDALVEFEKSLITIDAPFDLYLKGDQKALSDIQVKGYQLFQSYGCVACHQGQNIGGNMFQALGVANDYFKERGGSYPSDLGRYNVTKREEDKHVFKVPSLRNVALTAPYFHDGSVATLEEAVAKMARYQLGRPIPANDQIAIVAFLTSLTGKTPPSDKLTAQRESANEK